MLNNGGLIIEEKTEDKIINLYLNTNTPIRELDKMYSGDLYHMLKKHNIPSRRFYQKYDLDYENNIAYIYIKSNGGYLKCIIDIEDVEKCKNVGIWSVTKAGYVMNCKTGIYIHRLIMNCPDDMEVDHIYHDLLDNRKSMLRVSTNSQQIMNTKRRIDNSSGNRGIYYDKSRNTWNININFNNNHYRKRYKNKSDAIKERNKIYEFGFGDFRYKTKDGNYNIDWDGEGATNELYKN